jgi:hypothetical protein
MIFCHFLQSIYSAGNTKGGKYCCTIDQCLTGLESAVWQLTIFVFICKTDESKPVKQEVNDTAILPPLVFPVQFSMICQTLFEFLFES